MAKNIEINMKMADGSYEVLYPLTTSNQIITQEGREFVTRRDLVDLGITTWFNISTWDEINSMLQSGLTDRFNVGDTKGIILNGTAGSMSWFNQKAYVTIIGINHNSSREGSNRLHLQVALNDTNTQLLGEAQMNSTSTNVGGWGSSQMRTRECAQFLNCLPADLRAVVKDTTKWTSAGNRSSSVVSTTDKIFLLSEYEIFGTTSASTDNEKNYQARYKWYRLDNTNQRRIKYQRNSLTNAQRWWERSPSQYDSACFCDIHDDGDGSYYDAKYSCGFAPCLCV